MVGIREGVNLRVKIDEKGMTLLSAEKPASTFSLKVEKPAKMAESDRPAFVNRDQRVPVTLTKVKRRAVYR